MTNIQQQMKSDMVTLDRRNAEDQIMKDSRDRNDDLTEERRYKADKIVNDNRVRNDEETAIRRQKNEGLSVSLVVSLVLLAVVAIGTFLLWI